MKSTKRSLIFSALSVLVCVTMLLGTTYAWFTDTVTSGRNKIIAGNLDVELFSGDVQVGETTMLFDDVELWEPGVVEYETLTVKNVGNLALKYSMNLIFDNEVKYDGHGLSEVLKVGTIDGEVAEDATRESVIAAVDSWEALASFTKRGNLDAGESDGPVTYVIYWEPGTNDNLYNMNNEKQGNVLSIDFGIELVATQDTVEVDSFDELYDIEAPWLGDIDAAGLADNTDADAKTVEIANGAQLAAFAAAVNAGEDYTGYTVKLIKDIDLNNVSWTPIKANNSTKAFTFDGNGKTIVNLKVAGEKAVGLFAYATSLTIKDLTVDGANVSGINHVGAIAGNALCTKIENCTVKNAVITTSVKNNDDGDKAGAIAGYLSGEPTGHITGCTVENATVTGYRDIGALLGIANGKATVTGNTVKDSTVINDRSVNYKEYETDDEFDAEEVVGETAANATVEDNTATNVSIEVIKAPIAVEAGATPEATQANVNDAVAAATAGDTIIIPTTDDAIKLPTVPAGVTLKGDGETKIDATGALPNIDDATLDGFVIDFGQSGYHGFTHSDAVIKNCTIKGLLTSYNAGGEQVFENCTFINDKESGEYNMWAYGNVSYKNCTFKSYGKFVNVYNEGTAHFDVNFDGCTFVNLKSAGNKAGANVKDTSGANQLNITVTINDCTYEGAAVTAADSETLKVFNNVVQIDDIGAGPTNVKIIQDGVTLWPQA